MAKAMMFHALAGGIANSWLGLGCSTFGALRSHRPQINVKNENALAQREQNEGVLNAT
jgi:hypothetical protein